MSVRFFCLCDKVYQKQKVRLFGIYYIKLSPDSHNPNP